MSYVPSNRLNITSDIREARYMARMSVADAITLCDISPRTWYRWQAERAPRWAVRLILSQCGHLDHLGWKNWEIRGGRLYFNELSWLHWWEPKHLVMPLFGVRDVSILTPEHTDNLSGLISLHKAALAL